MKLAPILGLAVTLFGCGSGKGADGTHDTHGGGGDDSDSGTNGADAPDCGAYSGLGGVGTEWSYEYAFPASGQQPTWTFSMTVTDFDAETGAVTATYAGNYNGESDLNGTYHYLCDADGLQLVDSSVDWTSTADGTDQGIDAWAYDPPLMLIPYDVTGDWSFRVAGTHTSGGNAYPFDTTGTGNVLSEAPVTVPAGSYDAVYLDVYHGTSHFNDAVVEGVGLAQELDEVRYIYQNLDAHTP